MHVRQKNPRQNFELDIVANGAIIFMVSDLPFSLGDREVVRSQTVERL
jgi:hypothetical protein